MRLIDADALNKKLCETTIFIEDGEVFQRMINDAPTIEPDGDLISRQDAIDAIMGEPTDAHYPSWYAQRIKLLPSAPDSRQRGEWIFNPKDAIELMFTKPKCSECGFESADGGNFCSNCGADMRKGGAE